MYMAHGGSNFGLTAGANYVTENGSDFYQAHVTSYDYESPINEQGSPTEKFFALKTLISSYVDWDVPQVPDKISMIEIK